MRFGNLAGLLMKRLGPPVVRLEHVVADVADECASGAGHGGQSAASTGQRQEKSRMSPFSGSPFSGCGAIPIAIDSKSVFSDDVVTPRQPMRGVPGPIPRDFAPREDLMPSGRLLFAFRPSRRAKNAIKSPRIRHRAGAAVTTGGKTAPRPVPARSKWGISVST